MKIGFMQGNIHEKKCEETEKNCTVPAKVKKKEFINVKNFNSNVHSALNSTLSCHYQYFGFDLTCHFHPISLVLWILALNHRRRDGQHTTAHNQYLNIPYLLCISVPSDTSRPLENRAFHHNLREKSHNLLAEIKPSAKRNVGNEVFRMTQQELV